MSKSEYTSKYFRITHTIEEDGPHVTTPYDFYEDTFVITAIIRGKGSCYIEGNTYPLSDGNIVIMSPHDIHSFRFDPNSYHERVSMYLSSGFLSFFNEYELSLTLLFSTDLSQNCYIFSASDSNRENIAALLETLCHTMQDREMLMKDARIHLLILQIILLLFDSQTGNTAQAHNYTQHRVITEICEYIKEHLAEDLSYDTLMKRLFVSRYQLTVKFKEIVGMTLTEYIITKRLMRVISLVRSGTGLENAVYESGFNTYSHFYKEFLKHFSISPKKYFTFHKIQEENGYVRSL